MCCFFLFLPLLRVDGHTIPLGDHRLGLCSLYVDSENSGAAEAALVAEKPGENRWHDWKVTRVLIPFFVTYSISLHRQGTQNFGGIRVGNGPTEDEAQIIQHDQLSQHSEEEPEVTPPPHLTALGPLFVTEL